MNTLKLTTQFKKDLKRYKHKTEVTDKLEVFLNFSYMVCLFRMKTDLMF